MLALIVDLLSWALLVSGGLVVAVGGIGLVRFPDVYTRLHAAGVTDTLGATLVLAGLTLQAGVSLVAVKLLVVWAFLLFTSPVASHALARAALAGGVSPKLDRDSADD